MVGRAAIALMICLAFVPTAVQAQAIQCGEVELLFLNPGLQPGGDGVVDASGSFFAQFQAIGARAADIATFGFSFGLGPTSLPEDACMDDEALFTGQALQNYRADRNPDDGFFINLQTPLVPDGQYSAAVHAYDAQDNEIARFWAPAIVDNCDGDVGSRCDGDQEQNTRQDIIEPWPIVLPGDGQKLDEVTGFSIEFAEPLSFLDVRLNGLEVTDELEPWSGRLWDDDLFPGYGPMGLGDILAPECEQQPPQECNYLGEAYQWNVRALTEEDVLRVEARDLAGNLAVKDVHIGSGITGGALSEDIPVLSWSVEEDEIFATPGQSVEFHFTLQNRGAATGHPFARDEAPAGWESRWDPPHEPVPSGQETTQKYILRVPSNATAGPHVAHAYMDYRSGNEDKSLEYPVTVIVDSPNLATEESSTSEVKEAPFMAPTLLLLAAALVLRRSRA